jgi:hypothetical protein
MLESKVVARTAPRLTDPRLFSSTWRYTIALYYYFRISSQPAKIFFGILNLEFWMRPSGRAVDMIAPEKTRTRQPTGGPRYLLSGFGQRVRPVGARRGSTSLTALPSALLRDGEQGRTVSSSKGRLAPASSLPARTVSTD